MEPTLPQDDAFRIQLPMFEGPLDLLLHLIQKHELNILDLPIAFVTERYLAYLNLFQDLNLDMASEYLVMAATLAHIKSKLLLPTVPADQDDEEPEEYIDPREALIRRLLEYQKYKEAAESLGGRSVAGRDVFGRGVAAPEAQGPAPLAEIGLFKLLDAFQAVLQRSRSRIALEVTAEQITIQERMGQIVDRLRPHRTCTFEALFDDAITRYQMVVTLLALLEMAKRRMIRIYQADHTSPIHIQYALLDETDPAVEGLAPEGLAEAAGGEPDDRVDTAEAAEDPRDDLMEWAHGETGVSVAQSPDVWQAPDPRPADTGTLDDATPEREATPAPHDVGTPSSPLEETAAGGASLGRASAAYPNEERLGHEQEDARQDAHGDEEDHP